MTRSLLHLLNKLVELLAETVTTKQNCLRFSAQFHKRLVDGINFIEQLSFEAFNEGVHRNASTTYIAARTKSTEILWIFFGIHTANAVRMIAKVEKWKNKRAA